MEKAVEVDESEARAHYEKHPERYKIPEEIIFQEIMVADKATAEDLMKQIRAGADMADLATRHSIRRYADENGGLYAMRAFERMVYQELMDAAVEAPTDQLMGPIQLKEPMPSSLREPRKLKVAYSVFKVLERLPERVQTFEASREKAMFYARQAKQQERVEHLTAKLRNKYVAEWGINDDELTRYTESVTGG
jgi:parvulin-like peptidyl-prolyl isomerase